MSEVLIYGASDDLIEVEGGINGADEFSSPSGRWSAFIEAPNGDKVTVYAKFEHNGYRSVGASSAGGDDDPPMPPWPISIRQGTKDECTYSAVLVLDVPEGSMLSEVSS